MWQSIKISILFHKSTHQTIPIWLKRIFGKFLNFPEKLTLCAKFEQKWFCWDFEVLPPEFVTINQNFSPIPQICTPTLPFWLKRFPLNFSIFHENLHCVQHLEKNCFTGILKSCPLIIWQSIKILYSYSTNLHTKQYHSDDKNFWKISHFRRKTDIVCEIGTRIDW